MNLAKVSSTALMVIGWLLFMFAVSGCNPAKKAAKQEKKAEGFYNANPEKLRLKSDIMFPDRISQMVKGEAYTASEAISVDSVTVPGVIREVRTIERVRVDTLYKEDGRVRAELQKVNLALDSVTNDYVNEVRAHAQTEIESAVAKQELAEFKSNVYGFASLALIGFVVFLLIRFKLRRL